MNTFHKILPAIPFALARGVVVALVLTLAGCATLPPALGGGQQASADRYNAGQVQQVQQVQLGTVLSVRGVTIHQTPGANAGDSLAGAAIGGLLGHQLGRGNGKLVSTAALAMVGTVAGNKLGDAVGSQDGLSVTIRLDSGQVVNVAQAADVRLLAGQRVQLIGGGWNQPARVVPMEVAP
jgi:outer membrane lipoprotein SlyB